MSKIYTIKLEDEVPLSLEYRNNIRTICYLLYDEINRLETEDREILYRNDHVIYNELLEDHNVTGYTYQFVAEKHHDKPFHYEPFMLNDYTFGFSVYDDAITDYEICTLLNAIQLLIKTNYRFIVDSYYFETDHNRSKLISSMQGKKRIKTKTSQFMKKRVNA